MNIFKEYQDIAKLIYFTTKDYFGFSKRNLSRTVMAASVLGIELLNAFVLYELTQYLGGIDEALSLKKDFPEFMKAGIEYIGARLVLTANNVLQQYLLDRIAESLNKDMRDNIIKKWLEKHNHYNIGFDKEKISNPEQKLTDDISALTSTVIHTAYDMASLPIKFSSSVYNLAHMSGTLPEKYLGKPVPGYMIYPVIAFSITTNLISNYLGKPFKNICNKYLEIYASYREKISYVERNSAAISAIHGEKFEHQELRDKSNDLYHIYNKYDAMSHIIQFWNLLSSSLNYMVTAIIVWPKFQSGEMSLAGYSTAKEEMTKLSDVFSFKSHNLTKIAVAEKQKERIDRFNKKIDYWQKIVEQKGFKISNDSSESAKINNMSIYIPNNLNENNKEANIILLESAMCELVKGWCYRVTGPSGIGKTTFLKAFVDAWPYTEGKVSYPISNMDKIYFIPQKPLEIREGFSLMQQIAYPDNVENINKQIVIGLMNRWGLAKHIPNKDKGDIAWNNVLSGGERQKISIISAIAKNPQLLIMDESMSQLDEQSKIVIQNTIKEMCKDVTILFVDHAPAGEFHDAEIKITNKKKLAVSEVRSLSK